VPVESRCHERLPANHVAARVQESFLGCSQPIRMQRTMGDVDTGYVGVIVEIGLAV
jgi:dUTPase